jgi:hypothetical protein
MNVKKKLGKTYKKQEDIGSREDTRQILLEVATHSYHHLLDHHARCSSPELRVELIQPHLLRPTTPGQMDCSKCYSRLRHTPNRNFVH